MLISCGKRVGPDTASQQHAGGESQVLKDLHGVGPKVPKEQSPHALRSPRRRVGFADGSGGQIQVSSPMPPTSAGVAAALWDLEEADSIHKCLDASGQVASSPPLAHPRSVKLKLGASEHGLAPMFGVEGTGVEFARQWGRASIQPQQLPSHHRWLHCPTPPFQTKEVRLQLPSHLTSRMWPLPQLNCSCYENAENHPSLRPSTGMMRLGRRQPVSLFLRSSHSYQSQGRRTGSSPVALKPCHPEWFGSCKPAACSRASVTHSVCCEVFGYGEDHAGQPLRRKPVFFNSKPQVSARELGFGSAYALVDSGASHPMRRATSEEE